MTLTVQSDAGDVAGANSYLSVADFKAYHDARGNSYVGKTDPQIEQALVRATDYVDARFVFRGIKVNAGTQTTKWPRQAGSDVTIPWWDINFASPDVNIAENVANFIALVGPDGEQLSGIPQALKNATAEYAMRALSILLFQDAPAPSGGRLIDSQSVRVGDIQQSITYAKAQGTGTFVMPAFPQADLMLARAGLIETGRTVFR